VGKVAGIVLSWVISPLFSAFFAIALFLFTRHFILRSPHHATRVYACFPLFVFIAVTVNTMFVILKGMKSLKLAGKLSDDEDAQVWIVLVISAAFALLASLFTTFVILPSIRNQIVLAKATREKEAADELEEQKKKFPERFQMPVSPPVPRGKKLHYFLTALVRGNGLERYPQDPS